ncbi:hypothetical protein [Streptomyces tubercidicus]|uniref:hypothetical protein n=1 Tax=Streptomyces tubercidicus TaxID=47759 RepID=UPI003F5CA30F
MLHEYATTGELEEKMARGVADLALGPRPEDWPGPVTVVGQERMVLVVPHPAQLHGRPDGGGGRRGAADGRP